MRSSSLRRRRPTRPGLLTVLLVVGLPWTAAAQQTATSCASIVACISNDGASCTQNCPPCISQDVAGVYFCVAQEDGGGGACPTNTTATCNAGIFALTNASSPHNTTNNSSNTIVVPDVTPEPTLAPTVAPLSSPPPPIATAMATPSSMSLSASSASPSPTTIALILSIVVGLVVIAALLHSINKAERRESMDSPSSGLVTSKPLNQSHAILAAMPPPAPHGTNGPSHAFFGSVTDDGSLDVGSHTSITSFQTASSTGFSNSLFQKRPAALGTSLSSSVSSVSSMSSISSVFQVAPRPRRVKSSVAVLDESSYSDVIMEEDHDGAWAHHHTPTRDSNSIVIMDEGDEEDAVTAVLERHGVPSSYASSSYTASSAHSSNAYI
ncbi:Aste57867_21648 [Aphanomyces stellatus]|uniref:Aste57867_21648 protein n=1 Tax=Aphanomyces stellatus TaxID=120398 RepID=A0A485LI30_9STRA|nr:hypothetical protein As57867_021579 [Aphanomyces stellatus]VFT98317.1 Aste57867_21648 [Aphanomyces stellatus]